MLPLKSENPRWLSKRGWKGFSACSLHSKQILFPVKLWFLARRIDVWELFEDCYGGNHCRMCWIVHNCSQSTPYLKVWERNEACKKQSVCVAPPTPHTASNAHSKLFCPLVYRFVNALSCDHILGSIFHIYLTNWRGLPEFCLPFVVLCQELDLVPSSFNINIVQSVGWSVWQNSEYVDNCRFEEVLYSFIMSVMAAVA